MVDTEAGILHWLPPHAPKAEPIAQSLEARLGRPVFIDNLANVMARNERWFGGGTDFPDLTVIVVGLGLGLGQYVDGAIRSGAHGFNPEFSHVKIGGGPDLPCPCGGVGCLAMVASIGAITSRATSASPSMIQLDRLFDQFEAVAAQARAGDARSIALFDDAGQMLGAAIANHINVWDPDKILLAVRHPAWIELVEGPLLRRIERDTLPPLRGRAVVEMKVVAQEGHARGAAALVIERLYGG